jgi:hypothetical protein
VEDRRQGEFGKGLDPRRDRAGDEGESILLVEGVDAEAGEVGDRIGEIAAPLALEPIEVGLGGDLGDPFGCGACCLLAAVRVC